MSAAGDRTRPTNRVLNWIWDTGTLTWVVMTAATAGGGAVTVANGADVTQGATGDAAVQGDNAGTISAKLRGLNKSVAAGLPTVTGLSLPPYDYVSMALSVGNTVETYTFKTGGAGGSTVATVTITYTDSTRSVFVSAVKT